MTVVAETKATEEPDFISQNGDLHSLGERLAWFRQRTGEARADGAVLCRYSVHETIPGLALFEAWKQYPTSQGDIRWQLVSAPASSIRSGAKP